MNKSILICAVIALALVALPESVFAGKGTRFDVMTQNQYVGADLTPLITAPDPASLIAAVETTLLQIAANNFPDRASGLAQLIADRRPAVVGLQEVVNITFDPDGPGPIVPMNGPPPFVDHLSETLDALAVLGEPYVAVASVQNLDISLPGITVPGLGLITLSVTDRNVILVRGDLAAAATPVPFSLGCARPSADGGPGCNYQAVAQVPLFFPPFILNIERGFVGIDIAIGDTIQRVVTTHHEVRRPDGTDSTLIIQALQAAELIQTLAITPNPAGANVVVIGDINSDRNDPAVPNPGPFFIPPFDQIIVPPYAQLVGAGYTDAWTLRPGASTGRGYVVGASCCQLNDLSNHQSDLDRRIDVIFSAIEPDKVKRARVLGDRVSDKTQTYGLWPSDHGSVAAELQF